MDVVSASDVASKMGGRSYPGPSARQAACACAYVYVPPSVVSVIVCELHGQGEGEADGERLELTLIEAGLLGVKLGDSPRVGDTDGETLRDALMLALAEPEQMGPLGQPHTVTPVAAMGLPEPSLTADAICRRSGDGPPLLTMRSPLPAMVSSARVRLSHKISEDAAPRLVAAGPPMIASRCATLPQST